MARKPKIEINETQYEKNRNAFIPPKPFNSWILNEDTCLWNAPVAMPIDDNKYSWNEQTLSWDLVEESRFFLSKPIDTINLIRL